MDPWRITAPIGKRVRMSRPAPWAGEVGALVRWERPYWAFGPLPVVLLDNGEATYVRDAEDWGPE